MRGENVRDAFGRPIGLMRHATQHKHFLELDDDFPLNHLGFHINNIYAVFRDPDMDEHLQEQRGRVYEAEDSPAGLKKEVVKLLIVRELTPTIQCSRRS